MYFAQVGAGYSRLSIPTSSVTLLDSDGNSIPFTTVGGNVSTGGPAPILAPEPGSLGLLLIGLVAVGAGYLKRRRPHLRQSC
jgi:hypothetical protein